MRAVVLERFFPPQMRCELLKPMKLCSLNTTGPQLLACLSLMYFLLPTLVRADQLDAILERGEFIWGGDAAGGAPFVFRDGDDLKGFEVELAELLAEQLSDQFGRPVKARFFQGNWDTLPGLLDTQAIDIVLNGYERTPERVGRYACSRPYYQYGLQLMARPDGKIRSWKDLETGQHTIGVLGTSAAEFYLQEHYPNTVVIEAHEDSLQPMERANNGLIDATLTDDCIAIYYANEARASNLTFIDRPVGSGYYIAMMAAEETRLQSAVNQAIARLLENGELKALYDRWDMNGRWQEITLRYPEESQTKAKLNLWEVTQLSLGKLVQAAGVSVFLAVVSMPMAILLGILIAIGRLYGPKFLGMILTVYVEVVRGTPLMLQLYAIFFLLPQLGFGFPPLVAAMIGLSINYSACEAEIYRAGLQAIPRGQMEAGLSLGMSRSQTIRRIILPQAFRVVIPPVTNDFIALFKETSVCSVITVVELTKQYNILAITTGAIVELAILTAALYLLMSYPLALFARWAELQLQTDR